MEKPTKMLQMLMENIFTILRKLSVVMELSEVIARNSNE
jgi:hypothetical protein